MGVWAGAGHWTALTRLVANANGSTNDRDFQRKIPGRSSTHETRMPRTTTMSAPGHLGTSLRRRKSSPKDRTATMTVLGLASPIL